MKILVTRTDRLGDLVLSLPAMALLKKEQPAWEVHAMVAPLSVPLVENEPGLSRIWSWHEAMSAQEHDQLANELREANFDAVVMLFYRPGLARLLRSVGIDQRFGPLSKWSSWFLLNRGVRQNRSAGHRHEAHYNIELVQKVLDRHEQAISSPASPQMHLSASQKMVARKFRTEHAGDGPIVLIHPGSGGSALDWEPGHYAAVANDLATEPGAQVFITGAGSDAAVIGQMSNQLSPAVKILLDKYDLREFMSVLAAGDLFLGPSTGPLHMASALGVPTLGLFPPAPTMHPDRWGPLRPDNLPPRNLVPDLVCPARRACRKNKCEFYNCLETITVASVLQAARELITIGRNERYSPLEDGS
ncbi:MAG: ADP-heptose:LPS heptosyltransferase [Candidatus Krumholzibacteriia bacterium]